MERTTRILPRKQLQSLLDGMAKHGFRLIGPTIQDGVIVLADVTADSDFPIGWTDTQSGGHYRLEHRGDQMVFGFAVGPHSLKRYLFPPARKLLSIDRTDSGLSFTEHMDEPEKIAVLGVRSCDVAAMLIQDRVFNGKTFPDTDYARRRKNLFIVAVNCARPATTCFCTSMGTGPRVQTGFDLALTEVYSDDRHDFLIESGSDAGDTVLDSLETNSATQDDLDTGDEIIRQAEATITKRLETDGIRDRILNNLNHAMWDDVAKRCLSCTNCTMACPTCFCSTVEEVTDLTGKHAERWQKWDTCFAVDHSYIHGGSIRKSGKSRYRQWMTHKLASWIDQFDTSGCTGCGRCITWCPVGIDITEEVAKIE